jgi:hypothetical protein
MVELLTNAVRRIRLVIISAIFAGSMLASGAASLVAPSIASADSCDPVNIIRCGLDQRSLQSQINSFKASYNSGSNDGHNDLKAVYRWSGATDASVSNMSTGNTKLGTLYKNGDIQVNGKVVGHDAWVSARFGAGRPGFEKVPNTDGVYARKTTTSFANPSAQVLVHFTGNGTADFAVMSSCGNAVKFPPKQTPPSPPKPQPKPELACVMLSGNQVTNTRKFAFTARATAKNTTITKYVFDYGDSHKDTVTTAKTSATASHTYGKDNTTYTARVTVFSKDFPSGKTSGDCTFKAKTPKPTECKPGIPQGDKRCTECKPGVPEGSSECQPPTLPPAELPHTGAGDVIGVFGATAVVAAIGHRLLMRRKLN